MEARYTAHMTNIVFIPAERQAAVIHLACNLVFYLVVCRIIQAPVTAFAWLYPFAVAAHYMLSVRQPAFYMRHRWLVVGCLRVLCAVISCLSIPLWFPIDGSRVMSLATAARHLLISSGITIQVFLAYALRVTFQAHLLLTLFVNVIFHLHLNRHACACLEAGGGMPYVERVWEVLKHWAQPFSASLVGALHALEEGPQRRPCWAVVSFFQVLLAVCLPSWLLLNAERRSRAAFSQALLASQARTGPPDAALQLAFGAGAGEVVPYLQVLLVILLALAWWELLVVVNQAGEALWSGAYAT